MPRLVLNDLAGAEVQAFNFTTLKRAYEACQVVRSQLCARSKSLFVIGDLTGDGGFKIQADGVHQANVDQIFESIPDHHDHTERYP